jgi:hypothetical protein
LLDELNGYKEIKLGKSIENYDYIRKTRTYDETSVTLRWVITSGGTLMFEREYNGEGISEYGGFENRYIVDKNKFNDHPFVNPVEVIWVDVFNGLISSINIVLGPFQTGRVYDEFKTFEELLGPPSFKNEYSINNGISAGWISKNVTLTISTIHNVKPPKLPNGNSYYYIEDEKKWVGWSIQYVDNNLQEQYDSLQFEIDKKNKEKRLEELKSRF